MQTLQYRGDIDGLRALAVTSVLVFHFYGDTLLAGGFVGVDVFFVISGYLITRILKQEADEGRLSIVEFYHRRVRRIFPALLVVYLACLALAGALLLPAEAENVGREVLASLAFVSNVMFARADGYFDEMSRVDPLLHTWSLSVEEQFYLGLPLLLWGLSRFRPSVRLGALAALSLGSLALAVHGVAVDARSAFFLVHCRAWELLLGSLLALDAFGRIRSQALAEGVGALGLLLIAGSALFLNGSTPFPGLWALPACLGSVALLHSGAEHRTAASRVLSTAPLRYIGLVSYSLYLWHWPLLAFYRLQRGAPTQLANAALLASSFAAAALSYRFVEQPFRKKPALLGRRALFLAAGAAAALVAALTIGVPRAAAALRPIAPSTSDLLGSMKKYAGNIRSGVCFLNSGYADFSKFSPDECLKINPERPSILVLGDSHAAHFSAALRELYPELNVLQATAAGCQPLRDESKVPRCNQLNAYVFDEFLPAHHVRTVVLAGHWPGNPLKPLKRTIAYARRYADQVVVLGPPVQYDEPFPRLLARSIAEDDPTLPERHLLPGPQTLDRRLAKGLRGARARYLSVSNATCPKGTCTLWAAPGVPMQLDTVHLTKAGAMLVLNRLGPKLLD